MCGIFALLNTIQNNNQNTSQNNNKYIDIEFMKGRNRGPEFSVLDPSYMKMILGFHRLAINGLNDAANQPLVYNDIILICNGEIYNYKKLYSEMGVMPITQSDCEVIIHLYIRYGIEHTLTLLDGVFSFVLFDNRITEDLNNKVYVARDPIGIRPLYVWKYINKENQIYGFASELKCLERFYNDSNKESRYINKIQQFQPGTYSVYNLSNKVHALWEPIQENISYFIPPHPSNLIINDAQETEYTTQLYKSITEHLQMAVNKRCLTTERPIACLLSGGLDSSLITALVHNYYKLNNIVTQLETYSIGLSGSEDLKYAKIVAEYLGTKHTEIIVTEKQMFDAIPEVIYAIESYDTTTVRASIGNYLIGKYIQENSEAKVIFNGDGSDELFGGYLYMNKCPDDIEFDKETRRLLKDIHTFDVLRSDKSISSNGLEPRTPFLDKTLVSYILSIMPYFRNHKNYSYINEQYKICGVPEKFILRYSFSIDNFSNWKNQQLLPNKILWRKKEAFSDGVSSQGNSLYQIIQNRIAMQMNVLHAINSVNSEKMVEANIDTEKKYYKEIFVDYFSNCQHIIPYYWMPKYVETNDPSARTLDFYSDQTK
jgi:asparagine synthase (glutamine-hydrolysing)